MWGGRGGAITQPYSFHQREREREKKILTYVCKHHTNYHLAWRNLGAAAAGTEKKRSRDVDECMWSVVGEMWVKV